MASDSSLFACGGVFGTHWFSLELLASIRVRDADIAVKELSALVLSVLTWGGRCSGSRLFWGCDNQAVVAILSSGTSRNPVRMSLIRFFVIECLSLNVAVYPLYVRSEVNSGPDLLSRMNVAGFLRWFLSADPAPTPVLDIWRRVYGCCLQGFYGAV